MNWYLPLPSVSYSSKHQLTELGLDYWQRKLRPGEHARSSGLRWRLKVAFRPAF